MQEGESMKYEEVKLKLNIGECLFIYSGLIHKTYK